MTNRTVLVIEDNELNVKLIQGIAKIGHFDVVEAVDAESGIQLARRYMPFLILMDIQLPGMDGLAATRIIKSDPQLKQIPVVALTGFAMEGDKEKALAAGCNGYVTKPIKIDEVLRIIDSFSS